MLKENKILAHLLDIRFLYQLSAFVLFFKKNCHQLASNFGVDATKAVVWLVCLVSAT